MGKHAEVEHENRAHRRHRTLKTAQVIFNDENCVMNCHVRDMSEGGAKARFDIPFICPSEIILYFPIDEKQGQIRHCETAWIKGTDVGFRFRSDSHSVHLDEIFGDQIPEANWKATWALS